MKRLINKFGYFYHSQDYMTQAIIDTVIIVGGLLFTCFLAFIAFIILTL